MPLPERPDITGMDSIRHNVTFSERRFDVKTLPVDLQVSRMSVSRRCVLGNCLLAASDMTASELRAALCG